METTTENTFKAHNKNLQSIAAKLKEQSAEPDIDALVDMVESASVSYAVCKDRIDRAKAAIQDKLGNGAAS